MLNCCCFCVFLASQNSPIWLQNCGFWLKFKSNSNARMPHWWTKNAYPWQVMKRYWIISVRSDDWTPFYVSSVALQAPPLPSRIRSAVQPNSYLKFQLVPRHMLRHGNLRQWRICWSSCGKMSLWHRRPDILVGHNLPSANQNWPHNWDKYGRANLLSSRLSWTAIYTYRHRSWRFQPGSKGSSAMAGRAADHRYHPK